MHQVGLGNDAAHLTYRENAVAQIELPFGTVSGVVMHIGAIWQIQLKDCSRRAVMMWPVLKLLWAILLSDLLLIGIAPPILFSIQTLTHIS